MRRDNNNNSADVITEEGAAYFLRELCCGGVSRKLIGEDPEALAKYIALERGYRIHAGLPVEETI
jgi:hypothetical protein